MKLQIMMILITNILQTSDSKTMNGIVQIYISKTNTLEDSIEFWMGLLSKFYGFYVIRKCFLFSNSKAYILKTYVMVRIVGALCSAMLKTKAVQTQPPPPSPAIYTQGEVRLPRVLQENIWPNIRKQTHWTM